jgi:NAD(P)-dependent dehydrogenase (short-subunit alcohol dehydrogenase family)
LDEVLSEYGKIDGVIHAAGIIEDRRFKDKEADSFERVYNTKVSPLSTIVDKLLPGLKLLALFSSSSSTFGNVGQCDYAAGNSVLDGTAQYLKARYPDLRVVSFNWGPWSGAGMVSGLLEQEFRRNGISLITLENGCRFFIDEISYGADASVLAMATSEDAAAQMIDAHFGGVKQ